MAGRGPALLLAVVTVLTVALGTASPSRAHAVLQSVSPSDGAALDEAPARVTLTFNERVTTPRAGIRVFDSEGDRVDRGNARTVEPTESDDGPEGAAAGGGLAVDLRDDLGAGTYVVTWRAVSADGHPLKGAWLFTVGGAAADTALVASLFDADADRGAAVTAVAVRWLTYATALFAGGAAVVLGRLGTFMTAERRARVRSWIIRAAVGAVILTVLGMGTQAMLLTGLGAAALLDPAALGDVVTSGYGVSAAVRLVGLGGVLVWAAARPQPQGTGAVAQPVGSTPHPGDRRVPRRLSRSAGVPALAAGILTVASFALEGHTLTTSPLWLVMGSAVIHLVTAAVWGAGLVLVWGALRDHVAARPVTAARLVAAFSGLATWTIAAVALAGGALAWVQVRQLQAVATPYGWTLVAKLVALAPVAVIAVYNHRRLVPDIATAARDLDADRESAPDGVSAVGAGGRPVPAGGSDDGGAPVAGHRQVVGPEEVSADSTPELVARRTGRLRRVMAVEIGCIVAVLGITAVLVGLQPAAEAAGVTGAYSTYVPLGDDHELNLTVDPNRAGPNEIHLYVLGADGRQTDVASDVMLELNQPARDIGPLRRETQRLGPGHFFLSGPEMSVPGTWEITVEVPVTPLDVLTATVPVTVQGR